MLTLVMVPATDVFRVILRVKAWRSWRVLSGKFDTLGRPLVKVWSAAA